jgi:hypothetical protein
VECSRIREIAEKPENKRGEESNVMPWRPESITQQNQHWCNGHRSEVSNHHCTKNILIKSYSHLIT